VQTFAGPRTRNPFIAGQTETPYIPGLIGGAEAFGLLNGITAQSPEFDSVRNGAPVGASVAILRRHLGPTGYADDYVGFDMLLLINLSNAPVSNPRLGIDLSGSSGFMTNLVMGGYNNDPEFGGPGYQLLSQLAAGQVYATLIPEGTASVNVAANGRVMFGASLTNGSVSYLTSGGPVFAGCSMAAPGQFRLQAIGTEGLNYTLQTSTNLVNWLDRTNLVAGPGGLIEYLEDMEPTAPAFFYRLRWP
jgi:hypothetical protein